MVSPLVSLILLKKEGKEPVYSKLKVCVVVDSTALYYLSNIYVLLLKYSRGHGFDHSVAVETRTVCGSEIFTSFQSWFQGHVLSLKRGGVRKDSADAATKFFEGETELMASGEVTGPDKDDS